MADDIARQRLRNQRLAGNPGATAAQVVRHLCAVQSQDYRGGLWAVGLRVKSATEDSMERALADRSIVRTWPMRGTLHFVAAEDVRWMLPLLTPRVVSKTAGRHRQLELTPEVLRQSRRLFEKKLRGGVRLTRNEMYQALAAAGISPTGQRGIHIIGWLAQDGLICFGPRKGKQHTFVLLDEWAPPASPRTRQEALAELALRYFSGHGPATVQDFAWWAGLTLGDARGGLDAVSSRLARQEAGGAQYWGPAGGPPRAAATAAPVLLPPFDELLVGYTDRAASVDPAHVRHLGNLLSPTIMLGGRVVGTWRRRQSGDKVTVESKLFASPKGSWMRGLEAAVRRYGEFIGATAELA